MKNKRPIEKVSNNSHQTSAPEVPSKSSSSGRRGRKRKNSSKGSQQEEMIQIEENVSNNQHWNDKDNAETQFTDNSTINQGPSIKIKIPNHHQNKVISSNNQVPNFQDKVEMTEERITFKSLKRKSNNSLGRFEDVSNDHTGQLTQHFDHKIQDSNEGLKKQRFSLSADVQNNNGMNFYGDANVTILFEQLGNSISFFNFFTQTHIHT